MHTRRTMLDSIVWKEATNASLWLDKFIKGQNEQGESEPFKQDLISEVTCIPIPDIYRSFYEQWKEALTVIEAKFKNLRVDGRVIVGLGDENVLEASIRLHRTYGVPFIPGSALKGLASRYADRKLADKSWRKGDKVHSFVFGSGSSAGFITFHDALLIPNESKPIQADVMTVHHSDYYGGKTEQGELLPPADWDSPIPIPFLSATGDYLVAISGIQGAEKWIEFVMLILEQALKEEGIGAKTSSGYGRATLTDPPPSQKDKENWLDASVAQIIKEIETLNGPGKEMKEQLRGIALKHINRGNLPEEHKHTLASALVRKIEKTQIDLSTAEWYAKVRQRAI